MSYPGHSLGVGFLPLCRGAVSVFVEYTDWARSIGVSSGTRDPEALLVDKQWLARAVPRRKAGASQRANSLDGRVTAKQIQSMTSHGFPRAQPPRWRIHCQRRHLRNQAAQMVTEGLQFVSARPQESVPSSTRSQITVAISDRENWQEEILSNTLGIWFEHRSSYYEGHHQHGAGSGCDREPSGVCIHRRYLRQWGCCTRDLHQRTSCSVWTRMQGLRTFGKQHECWDWQSWRNETNCNGGEQVWFPMPPASSHDGQYSLCVEDLSGTFQCVAGSMWLAGYLRGEQVWSHRAGTIRLGMLSSSAWCLRLCALCREMIQLMVIGVQKDKNWMYGSMQVLWWSEWLWRGTKQCWRMLAGCVQRMTPNISTLLSWMLY